MKVYWTQFAEDKLEDIFAYYKFKAGINVAKEIVNGIIDTTLVLENSPYIGQKEELLEKRSMDFRYLIFKKYKIIYQIDEISEVIFISHVFDTRQNPGKLKELK
jgi:plasmid stabilization system protein ParE